MGNKSNIVDEYLSEILPIILKNIRKSGSMISGYRHDDLIHEGYIAALAARDKWISGGGGASLKPFAGVYIENRFKELAKISFLGSSTYSIDDDENNAELTSDDTDEIVEMFFNSGLSGEAEDEEDDEDDYDKEFLSSQVDVLLKTIGDKKSQDQFVYLILKQNCSPVLAAKKMRLTESRISQIKKEITVLKSAIY